MKSPTANSERGYRLQQVVSQPGFHDVQAIIDLLCQSTFDAIMQFQGWDGAAAMVLVQRVKAAYELRDNIYSLIQRQISAGNDESYQQVEAEAVAQPEATKAEEADALRERALKLYDTMYPKQPTT